MNGKLKILITGGLGNLGSWLTHYFTREYEVYVLSKNVANKLECNYHLIQADITNLSELKLKLNKIFDYCIHTASYNEFFHDNYLQKALDVNTLGTRNLIETLKSTQIKKFIYLSTFHVYGASSGNINEESPLYPKNDYASTHLFSEYYIKQFYQTENFPFVIFRLTNSYGAPKYMNSSKWYLVLNDLVKTAFNEKEILLKGNGKASRDFIWMQDVCTAIEKSFDIPSSLENIFNLGSSKSYTMLEIAQYVQKVYAHRYNKDIKISINKNDTTKFLRLRVDNAKLKHHIAMNFQNKFEDEISAIFSLLENN